MQDLITEAMKMFDSYEKWNAFIELSNSKNAMRQRFYEKFKNAMWERFTKKDNFSEWRFVIAHNEQYRWVLKDFSNESICILWRPDDMILWCSDFAEFRVHAAQLLKSIKYKELLAQFERPFSFSSPKIHHFCEQKHLYDLGNGVIYSGAEDPLCEKLAWLAGNMTDVIVGEIEKQVNKFRTPEITQLLLDLNRECQEAVKG